MKIKLLTFIAIPALIMGSCIQTSSPDVPKRVDLTFNVSGVGSEVVVEQDTALVTEFKLLADRFNIILADSTILQSRAEALILSYREENQGEDELVLSTNIGFEEFEQFIGFELFIDQAEDSDTISDTDFFGSGSNFSIIMKGTLNSEEFTYQSGVTFERNFEFQVVELTPEKETLAIRVLVDIASVLTDEENNRLLDPTNEEDQTAISTAVENTLSIEAFAVNRLF